MAKNNAPSDKPSTPQQTIPASEAKPLSQKTHTELKRETRARLKHLDPLTATELVNEAVTRPVNGFVEFLREYGIVGVAVGFVLGSQIQAVVKQLISSFIDPIFQLAFPSANKHADNSLSGRVFTLHVAGRPAQFGWGAFVYDLIDFLFIAIAIYIIIKIFQLEKLKKR